MEEELGVKVTRLRRRLSVESEATQSPATPSTPNKKRASRLAKPALDLIDENVTDKVPKRGARKSIARDVGEPSEEKPPTPSRRSARIRSNTSLITESAQPVLDSPRARRAVRRNSQLGSDTETIATPTKSTRRTRKDSTSSVEKLALTHLNEKPIALVAEAITEETDKEISKDVHQTDVLYPNSRKNPTPKQGNKKGKKILEIENNENHDTLAHDDKILTDTYLDKTSQLDKPAQVTSTNIDDGVVNKVEVSEIENLSLSSVNLINEMMNNPKKSSVFNKTVDWTDIESSKNEKSSRKRTKSFGNSQKEKHNSHDESLKITEKVDMKSQITSENKSSTFNSSIENKENLNYLSSLNALNAKDTVKVLEKAPSKDIKSMVFIEDSDSNSGSIKKGTMDLPNNVHSQHDGDDQCVPVVKQLTSKRSSPSESFTVEPMDIDETIPENVTLNDFCDKKNSSSEEDNLLGFDQTDSKPKLSTSDVNSNESSDTSKRTSLQQESNNSKLSVSPSEENNNINTALITFDDAKKSKRKSSISSNESKYSHQKSNTKGKDNDQVNESPSNKSKKRLASSNANTADSTPKLTNSFQAAEIDIYNESIRKPSLSNDETQHVSRKSVASQGETNKSDNTSKSKSTFEAEHYNQESSTSGNISKAVDSPKESKRKSSFSKVETINALQSVATQGENNETSESIDYSKKSGSETKYHDLEKSSSGNIGKAIDIPKQSRRKSSLSNVETKNSPQSVATQGENNETSESINISKKSGSETKHHDLHNTSSANIDKTINIPKESRRKSSLSIVETKHASRKSDAAQSENNETNKSIITLSKTEYQNLESSSNENNSTLVLSQLRDMSSNEVTNTLKSPKESANESCKSVSMRDVTEKKDIKNLSQDCLTSTPLQQKSLQKLGMQINTSIISAKPESKNASPSCGDDQSHKKSIPKIIFTIANSSGTFDDDMADDCNSKNEMIDDQAEETSDDYESGDSRNDEDLEYEKEHEIIERGETIESEDISSDSDYEKDSFLVSSNEEDDDLLSGSGDDLSLSDNELNMSEKSKKKFDERKRKEQKKASKEMFASRHKLNESDSFSGKDKKSKHQHLESSAENIGAVQVKKKNSSLDISNSEAGETIRIKKKKSKRLSESVWEGNDDLNEKEISINDHTVTEKLKNSKSKFKKIKHQKINSLEDSTLGSDNEEKDKPNKQNLLFDSSLDVTNSEAEKSMLVKKKKTKRLSEFIWEGNADSKEEEITINNQSVTEKSDPLSVAIKVEPKTPQKDLNISTVQISDAIENVEIDDTNVSMMNPLKTADPLQVTAQEDAESDSDISENLEIQASYDSVLEDLNKAKKQNKNRDTSLNGNIKTKDKAKESIIDQLNLTETKSKKKISQYIEETETTQEPGVAHDDGSELSDSIDMRLLFPEDSNDSESFASKYKPKEKQVVEAAEKFIPLKRTGAKSNIHESLDPNSSNTRTESVLNVSKKKNKNRTSHSISESANEPEETSFSFFIDTKGTYDEVDTSAQHSAKKNKKKHSRATSVDNNKETSDSADKTIAEHTSEYTDVASASDKKKKKHKNSDTSTSKELDTTLDSSLNKKNKHKKPSECAAENVEGENAVADITISQLFMNESFNTDKKKKKNKSMDASINTTDNLEAANEIHTRKGKNSLNSADGNETGNINSGTTTASELPTIQDISLKKKKKKKDKHINTSVNAAEVLETSSVSQNGHKKSKKTSECAIENEIAVKDTTISELTSHNVSNKSDKKKKKHKNSDTSITEQTSEASNINEVDIGKKKKNKKSKNIDDENETQNETPNVVTGPEVIQVNAPPNSDKKKKKKNKSQDTSKTEDKSSERVEVTSEKNNKLEPIEPAPCDVTGTDAGKKKKNKKDKKMSHVETESEVGNALEGASNKRKRDKTLTPPTDDNVELKTSSSRKKKRKIPQPEEDDDAPVEERISYVGEVRPCDIDAIPEKKMKKKKPKKNNGVQLPASEQENKNKPMKRKAINNHDDQQKSKVRKEHLFDEVHVPRLPESIINQLKDKPPKKNKPKAISTVSFQVEQAMKRKNKPSNYLEQSICLNDDESPVKKNQKASIKKTLPKVLPFVPTAITSGKGYTSNFKINLLPQDTEFVAQANDGANFKNNYLYNQRIKKLGTFERLKKHRIHNLSKF